MSLPQRYGVFSVIAETGGGEMHVKRNVKHVLLDFLKYLSARYIFFSIHKDASRISINIWKEWTSLHFINAFTGCFLWHFWRYWHNWLWIRHRPKKYNGYELKLHWIRKKLLFFGWSLIGKGHILKIVSLGFPMSEIFFLICDKSYIMPFGLSRYLNSRARECILKIA